jgi:hypothetical protein
LAKSASGNKGNDSNALNCRVHASPLASGLNRPAIQHRLSGSTTISTGALT